MRANDLLLGENYWKSKKCLKSSLEWRNEGLMLVDTSKCETEHACGVASGTNASYWWGAWRNEVFGNAEFYRTCYQIVINFGDFVYHTYPYYEACSDGKGPIRKKAEYSAKESQLKQQAIGETGFLQAFFSVEVTSHFPYDIRE